MKKNEDKNTTSASHAKQMDKAMESKPHGSKQSGAKKASHDAVEMDTKSKATQKNIVKSKKVKR